ncbi:hypothetical protein BHM03_00036821 [Ensete ventricosum]|nr:hypothetical protein BHM03_00036821 [Ensete ventricosum]
MESHPPPLLHRKWLLGTLACLLGYLLLSYSLEKAFRPSTTIVSFPGLHGAAKLTLSGDAEAPSENIVDVSPPSEAAMSPRPTTEAEMVSPQPSAVVENYVDVSPPSEAAMSPRSTAEAEMVSPKPSVTVEMAASAESPSIALLPQQSTSQVTDKEILAAKAAGAARNPAADAAEEGKVAEKKCDIFDGRWVYDRQRYPLYRSHWCPFLSDQVSCQRNGRPDSDYEHWRWQPSGCDLPWSVLLMPSSASSIAPVLLMAVLLLMITNTNMWESLACILYSSVRRKRAYVKWHSSDYKVFRALYQVAGVHTKHHREEMIHTVRAARTPTQCVDAHNCFAISVETRCHIEAVETDLGILSFVFSVKDYDCSVEFFWSPFLVELKEREDHAKVLRVDQLPGSANRWLGADVMVFNTGHWWTHHGKMRAWNYIERREQLTEEMEPNEAFNRALRTWARWVDHSVDHTKTTVFFRSVSPEHKRCVRRDPHSSPLFYFTSSSPTTSTSVEDEILAVPHNYSLKFSILVSEIHGGVGGENHQEDEDAGDVSKHHAAVGVPERCAHSHLHFEAREAPDGGAEAGTGKICRLQPLVSSRIT